MTTGINRRTAGILKVSPNANCCGGRRLEELVWKIPVFGSSSSSFSSSSSIFLGDFEDEDDGENEEDDTFGCFHAGSEPRARGTIHTHTSARREKHHS